MEYGNSDGICGLHGCQNILWPGAMVVGEIGGKRFRVDICLEDYEHIRTTGSRDDTYVALRLEEHFELNGQMATPAGPEVNADTPIPVGSQWEYTQAADGDRLVVIVDEIMAEDYVRHHVVQAHGITLESLTARQPKAEFLEHFRRVS